MSLPRKVLMFIVVVSLSACGLFAQQGGRISGTVTSGADESLIASVSVRVEGTRFGAVTGSAGEYEMSVPAGSYEIIVSHAGFREVRKSVTVRAGGLSSIDFKLSPSIFTMDQVVITGSRGAEIAVRNLPASVAVVTSEEMTMKNVRSIDDALKEIPGVQVGRTRGLATTGGHAGVSMRGTVNSNRTLVLKDGIPLNSSYTGSVPVWNTVSSCGICRIEVIKGAASTLYGSAAMGGVINLITDTPTLTPRFSARTEFGGNGSAVAGMKYAQAFPNKLGLVISGEYKKTDGYQYMGDENWKAYYTNPSNSLLNLSGKMEYSPRPGSKLQFIVDHHSEQPLTGTSTRYDSDFQENRFAARYDGSSGAFNYAGTLFFNRRTDKFHATKYDKNTGHFSKGYYDADIPKNETGFMGNVSTRLRNHILTAGTDIKLGSTESDYFYTGKGQRYFEGEQMAYSVFLNDEIALGKYVDLSLGLRYDSWSNQKGTFLDETSGSRIAIDYPERSDDRVSPKVGAVVHLRDDARLRVSYSTGFKTPSLYYLYRSAPHGSTKFDLANPGLKPEVMNRSIDIGGDFLITKMLEMSLTYYNSNFEDFMFKRNVPAGQVPSYLTPAEGQQVRQYVNIGEVDLQGVEASLKLSFADCWLASLAYTYNISEIKKHGEEPGLVGMELEDSPNHHFNLGLSYANPKYISAGVWMRTTGAQFSDAANTDEQKIAGFTTFDIKASRNIFANISLSAEVYNLFDKQYHSFWSSSKSYYYGPPRMAYVGLNYAY